MTILRKDLYISLIAGTISGALLLIPLTNIGFNLALPVMLLLPFTGGALTIGLFYGAVILHGRIRITVEFAKFFIAGGLTTLLDIALANLLILLTGIAIGTPLVIYKAISSLIAMINGYIWNKYWTFQNRRPVSGKEFFRFLLIATTTLSLNVGITSLIANMIGPPSDVEDST